MKNKSWSLNRLSHSVKCYWCGKTFKARIPKGGDGTQWNPSYHKKDGKICQGSYEDGEIVM